MFVPKALEYFLGSDILSGLGFFGFLYDFESVKQYFAYLLG